MADSWTEADIYGVQTPQAFVADTSEASLAACDGT